MKDFNVWHSTTNGDGVNWCVLVPKDPSLVDREKVGKAIWQLNQIYYDAIRNQDDEVILYTRNYCTEARKRGDLRAIVIEDDDEASVPGPSSPSGEVRLVVRPGADKETKGDDRAVDRMQPENSNDYQISSMTHKIPSMKIVQNGQQAFYNPPLGQEISIEHTSGQLHFGPLKDADDLVSEMKAKVEREGKGCPFCSAFATIIKSYDKHSEEEGRAKSISAAEINRREVRNNGDCFECQYLSQVLDIFCPQFAPEQKITLKPGRYQNCPSGRYPITFELNAARRIDLVRGYPDEISYARGEMFQYFQQYDADHVDLQKIRHWMKYCDRKHGAACRPSKSVPSIASIIDQIDFFLIDVCGNCLVRVDKDVASEIEYMALSYVWEQDEKYIKVTLDNRMKLEERNALHPEKTKYPIPETIKDAIRLTKALSKRYLWVDRFCIIQDDEATKAKTIQLMDAIYTNSILTIIAAGGVDSTYGLRGITKASIPRDAIISRRSNRQDGNKKIRDTSGGVRCDETSEQNLFIFDDVPMVRISNDNDDVSGLEDDTIWSTRGWTYQEHLLSDRIIIFGEDGRFEWRCRCAEWQEEYNWEEDGIDSGHPMRARPLMMPRIYDREYPDLDLWIEVINDYNDRSFTKDVDAGLAILGALNALSASFKSSFLHGLPELFFLEALLWQPFQYVERRGTGLNDDCSLPSWSWLRWKGALCTAAISSSSYIMEAPNKYGSIEYYFETSSVYPITTFYKWDEDCNLTEIVHWRSNHRTGSSNLVRRHLYRFKRWIANTIDMSRDRTWKRHRFSGPDDDMDWKWKTINSHSEQYTFRGHEFRTSWRRGDPVRGKNDYYYFHPTLPRIKFRYPIPLTPEARPSRNVKWSLLAFQTQHVKMKFGSEVQSTREDDFEDLQAQCLLDEKDIVVGSLFPNMSQSDPPIATSSHCDLIAISFGIARDIGPELFWRMDNWGLPEGLETLDSIQESIDPGKLYAYFNVLWIEWIDKIAYRKGLGRVEYLAWKSANPEPKYVLMG